MNLAIFLKAPVAGKVKTRLCPPLRESEAAELYAAFVEDLLGSAARTRCRSLWLLHEGGNPAGYLPAPLLERLNTPRGRLRELGQSSGELGQRLDAAVRGLAERGALPVLFVGSDHPDLPTESVDHLLVALPSADLLLGEARDGGVWGIGVSAPHPGFFASIRWSRPDTARSIEDRARRNGWDTRLLSPWYDVDEVDDLRALWQRLTRGRSSAPKTKAWLEAWPRRAEVLDELGS